MHVCANTSDKTSGEKKKEDKRKEEESKTQGSIFRWGK
jgi:hypothetical protein